MTCLTLDKCKITDYGIACLLDMKDLRKLDVTDCKGISDNSIRTLRSLPRLEYVRLSGTRVSKEVAMEFHKWMCEKWRVPYPVFLDSAVRGTREK
jgi:hypothetical protein